MKIGEIIQQGDVIIERIEKIPEDVTIVSDGRGAVLAEGEATGHYHAIKEGATVLKNNAGSLFLSVKEDTKPLHHQEHHTIDVPAGDYAVRIVQEYDHFEEYAREVAD